LATPGISSSKRVVPSGTAPSASPTASRWYRDGRYVALTRKQFAVLEVLVAAEGGVVSAEELLKRAWDQNADPFTNAVRITVSALHKRLGEPWIIATVPGVGYRIDTGPDAGGEGGKRG
jgi:two-component system, OmpR family, response regulator VanR